MVRDERGGLGCQKHLFDLPAGQHYINCAYKSPLSRRVSDAGRTAIAAGSVPYEIGAEDFFAGPNRLRRRFAELLGAPDPGRIAVIPSVSYAMATVARNLDLRADQNVVTAAAQFPSNVHPWRRHCAEAGAELRIVQPPPDRRDRAAEWSRRVAEAVDASTALVALGSVHWTDGAPFDLVLIGARAREVGALFVVDGTQSVGAAPFDFDAVQPDALVCAGYKWLTGPYSIGLAYYGDRFEGGSPVEESWMGKAGSEDFAALVGQGPEYRAGAARFDVGEASHFILAPMLQAGLEQVIEWGVPNIAAYTRTLRDRLFSSKDLEAVGVDAGEPGSAHLFGLYLPEGRDPDVVRAELAARGVHVSIRGAVVRVSPHVYNDESDIEALAEALVAALG